jgi:phosphatidylcholine synthase
VWNAVAFFLFLLRPGPWAASALIVVPAIFTFVPVVFVHPFRVVHLRALNAALLGIGGVLVVVALVEDLTPGPWVTGALCAICIYFLIAGLLRRSPDMPTNHR